MLFHLILIPPNSRNWISYHIKYSILYDIVDKNMTKKSAYLGLVVEPDLVVAPGVVGAGVVGAGVVGAEVVGAGVVARTVGGACATG
jgi:hypothetical protein